MTGITFSVFTKPWKSIPIPQLAETVRRLGYDGIELPVRPGFQVQPETIARQLPIAARQMADAGVKICSVAGNTDEATIAACAEAGSHRDRGLARRRRNGESAGAQYDLRVFVEHGVAQPGCDRGRPATERRLQTRCGCLGSRSGWRRR